MKRLQFIRNTVFGTSGLALCSAAMPMANEPYNPAVVKEFVGAGHNNLDRVKEMMANDPNLIHCRHDWGGGDFEEAIEGAGHVGNKEIVNYLLESGARLSIFTMTMLGQSDLVLPILKQYPNTIKAIGPHGFTLLHYAKVGDEDSLAIFDYLQQNGLTETKVKIF